MDEANNKNSFYRRKAVKIISRKFIGEEAARAVLSGLVKM